MFALSFGKNDSEGMKTIKSEFGGPLSQLISLWQSKSGGHAGGEVGLKGGKKNPRKTNSFSSSNMSETFAPSGSGSFPRCLLHRCHLVIG